MEGQFFNLYRHNFVRVAVLTPEVRVADPQFNARRTAVFLEKAVQRRAILAVFPELGLTGYSCEDLFHQQVLLDGAAAGLREVALASAGLDCLAVVGMPVRVDGLLFNCAAMVHRGRILGVVPKTYPPNYREFYELRHFAPASYAGAREIDLAGQRGVPFGTHLLFEADDQPGFVVAAEICEDLWTPIPPSSHAALAGATVLVNLSASNVTIGKDEYRSQLAANQSGRCVAAYVYCAAGYGESTTDLAWDGHGMIYENGSRLAQTKRFSYEAQLATADIDLDRIAQDRLRLTSFAQAVERNAEEIAKYRRIRFSLSPPLSEVLLLDRLVERFPYVPSDPQTRDTRCREVYEIQVQGLVKRLRAVNIDRVVIGVSGGLDSTQALIVCARAMDVMGVPRTNILAYTMPGFATSERTLQQAQHLMAAIRCSAERIDIRPACMQMLKDIGHPYANGQPVYDVTFENVQAGERTSHLFRLANMHNALVVGTGDLSELALGWCTYGVGDQMSHYALNASVPKTLIQYLIRYEAGTRDLGAEASVVLEQVLRTEISPELVPGNETVQPAQSTESIVGPYELQDFNLYYTLRFGLDPAKVAFMAFCAWRDRGIGTWPDVPEDERRWYSIAEIRQWLGVFLKRFFQASQYKRSAMPNAPKVGSGGSLSPRGDWRAPSDGDATAWLARLDEIPESAPEGF
ncbi:MAG: NAD(+) synthase [Betaproteobacteria bacterium RIFCSPLOWO2_12_FULL_63_13]|nr:MAG: NAD(+) synthase [Betaproteobacteria bacterium RIFCSPLOWO2_02_FULL_63_19]OGA45528.1 MAG: NAD(+) synthase [Betaproteobacteria bacterium RIFCSPLOWO2_12_FULL_63_13]